AWRPGDPKGQACSECVREVVLRPEAERERRGLGALESRYLRHIGSLARRRPRGAPSGPAASRSPGALLVRTLSAAAPQTRAMTVNRTSRMDTNSPPSSAILTSPLSPFSTGFDRVA